MKISNILLNAVFATLLFSQINIQKASAQDYSAIYDARCPVNAFPFGKNNFDQELNATSRHTSADLKMRGTIAQGRAGNTIQGYWVAWRNVNSHSLERRDLTDLPTGAFTGFNKFGLGTLSGGVDLKINPSKMDKGSYFFYFEQTTRDGDIQRVVYKVNVS